MHSAIYEGKVRHRRFSPVEHRFENRLYLMYVDLAELPELFRNRLLWSGHRANVAYLRRRDHLGAPSVPLDQAVRDLVSSKTGKRPEGPIRLLTHFRYFGHCFNPVSFYYCFDRQDARVVTVVAEVNNTPWGEQHCYVLDDSLNIHPRTDWLRFRFPKSFHVSPFMEMEIEYDWWFRVPGKTIHTHFVNRTLEGQRRFDATMTLRREAISGPALARVLLRYPLMTIQVFTYIYWHAFLLHAKKAPFHVHPAKRREP